MKTSAEYVEEIKNARAALTWDMQMDSCPHGRSHWSSCPWCTGLNEAYGRSLKAMEKPMELGIVDMTDGYPNKCVCACPCQCNNSDGMICGCHVNPEGFPDHKRPSLDGGIGGCDGEVGEKEATSESFLTRDELIRQIALDIAIDAWRGANASYVWPANSYVNYAQVFETYIRTGMCQA